MFNWHRSPDTITGYRSVLLVFNCVNTEHLKRTTEAEKKSLPPSKRERKSSQLISTETRADERLDRAVSTTSVDQLVSGTANKKTANHADFIPIVTHEGNEDTNKHREVNVIVHKSSSASSSTCSSVRSTDQRRHTTSDILRRQVSSQNHGKTYQKQIGQDECTSTSGKDRNSKQLVNHRVTDETTTAIVNCKESLELQVLTVQGATGGQRRNENKQSGKNLGGTLAAIFDF